MADRSLRRAANGGNVAEDGTQQQRLGDTISVPTLPRVEPNEPISDADNHRVTDTDDSDVDSESNRTVGIGIVEVSPDQLDKFIAGRATEHDAGDGGTSTRKRRSDSGTRRGSSGKRGGKRGKEETTNLAPLLTMVGTWASVLLKTPEFMFDETEVKTLSDSYATFAEHHDVPQLTEKRMSEINLTIAILSVAGPRIVAISNRKKNERTQSNVTQMPQRASVGH